MKGWRKLFMAYCAFAPFFSMAITATLYRNGFINDLWGLGFMACMFCVPFSAIFSLASLYRPKSGQIAIVVNTLASNGHMLFYAHLWFLTVSFSDPMMFVWSTQAGMIMSGIALLFLWDNEVPAQSVTEAEDGRI